MENLTRRKELAVASAIALVTTAAVIVAKSVGAVIVASFLAGAGTAITVGYVIIANRMLKQAGRKR